MDSCCALPHARLHLDLTTASSSLKNSVAALLLQDNIYRPAVSTNNKFKASNIPATNLIIGDWKWDTLNTGDLMAKIYYAKRRLVWEVLDGSLKSKIEIKWSDIIAIKATLDDQERGILEIELNQLPSFFRETSTQPRKHTNWESSCDFTEGRALICRIHSLVFPHKILDKHYRQLLQCDERPFASSQRPFPSQESPFFNPIVLQESHDFDVQGTRFPPGAQDLTNPTMAGDFTIELPQNSMVSSVINHQYSAQHQGTEFSGRNGNVQGPPYISSVTSSNPVTPYQNHQSDVVLFDNLQNNLLGGSEIVYTNEGTIYANVDSTLGQMGLNPDNSAATCQIGYDIGMQSTWDTYSWEIEHWNAVSGMTPQESVEWMTTPQVVNNSPMLELSEKYQKRFGPLRYFVAGLLKFLCLPKYSFEVEYLPVQRAGGEGKVPVKREIIDMSELYTDIMRRSSKAGLHRASSLSSIDSIMSPSPISGVDLDMTGSSTEPSEYVRAIDQKSKRLSAGRSNLTAQPEVIHPQMPHSVTPNWPRTRSKSRLDKGWVGVTTTSDITRSSWGNTATNDKEDISSTMSDPCPIWDAEPRWDAEPNWDVENPIELPGPSEESAPGENKELVSKAEEKWVVSKGQFLGVLVCSHSCKTVQSLSSQLLAPKAEHDDKTLDLLLVRGSG